jgi:chemotaxis protein MotB
MVSFGDMMTLILTFFILLVSLSREQQEGLVARGVGSFLVALRSFGLPGVLDESDEASIFENVRRRFNAPPESDPERRSEDHLEAAELELIRARAARALAPHDELNQPAVAVFAAGSAELDAAGRRYLDLIAASLRPARGQLLLLEGHATDAERSSAGSALAFARARAVAEYLIERGHPRDRVQARAWAAEVEGAGPSTRSVDARLVTPSNAND